MATKRAYDPDQVAAHQAVMLAVKQGVLPPIKTRECDECDAPAQAYHHYRGYAARFRLTVRPLCTTCHNKAHGWHRLPKLGLLDWADVPPGRRVTPDMYRLCASGSSEWWVRQRIALLNHQTGCEAAVWWDWAVMGKPANAYAPCCKKTQPGSHYCKTHMKMRMASQEAQENAPGAWNETIKRLYGDGDGDGD